MTKTSIFSFSQNIFNPVNEEFDHLDHIQIVVCKCFEFGWVFIFVTWKIVNTQVLIFRFLNPLPDNKF